MALGREPSDKLRRIKPQGAHILENPRELDDLESVPPAPNPDMSWWSEGLFIASIFPPLIPTKLQDGYDIAFFLSLILLAALFASTLALILSKPSKIRSRTKAITGGTAVGTLLLIGWLMLN